MPSGSRATACFLTGLVCPPLSAECRWRSEASVPADLARAGGRRCAHLFERFGGASKSGASIKAAGLSSSSSSLSSAAAYRQRHATFGIAYTSTLIEQAAEVERKVQSVDDMWPGLVQRVIKETLDGMARRKEVVTAAHNRWAAGGGGRERGGGGRKTGTTHSVSGGKGKNGGSSASSVNRGSSGDRSGSKNKSGSYFA